MPGMAVTGGGAWARAAAAASTHAAVVRIGFISTTRSRWWRRRQRLVLGRALPLTVLLHPRFREVLQPLWRRLLPEEQHRVVVEHGDALVEALRRRQRP